MVQICLLFLSFVSRIFRLAHANDPIYIPVTFVIIGKCLTKCWKQFISFAHAQFSFKLIFIKFPFQVAAKLQIAGQGGNNNKRPLDDLDDEPHSKRFSGGSDWSNSSMSPAHLQQAQQAAAQVAARLSGQPGGGGGYHQQNSSIPNPDAVQKAKELISKMIPQTNMGGGPGAAGGPAPTRAGLGATNYDEIMIPGSKVGLIIGKGGETIKQLQVSWTKENNFPARVINLTFTPDFL